MSVELWDILHDGVIEGVDGNVPGDLTLTVEIEYLRELFSDGGKNFIVKLIGCDTLTYQPDGPSELLDSLASEIPEGIHSGEADGDLVRVYCMNGVLSIRYRDFSLMLDNGQPITLAELGEKSQEYWDSFGRAADERQNNAVEGFRSRLTTACSGLAPQRPSHDS